MKLNVTDWNIIPYADAWTRQTEWFDALIRAKQAGEEYENHIILCEHPHVYTLGRSGKEGNMLLSEEQLQKIGATLYHIDRGGDITYHGPGQLVCYPILNLEEFSLGLKEYVHAVSNVPQGPYQFSEVALPARGAQYWDGRSTHNPRILKYNHKYYLIYMGSTHPFVDPTYDQLTLNSPWCTVARSNKRIGLAVADSPYGPWKRLDEPILKTKPNTFFSFLTSNPSPVVQEDGSVMMIFKGRRHMEDGKYSNMALGIAYAPTIEGPYRVLNNEQPIFQVAGQGEAEDPFLWKDDKGYHAIFKDHVAKFTGEKGGGVMAHSKDGINWTVDKDPKAYSKTVEWEDGTIAKQGQLERPFILFEDGKPTFIFFATMDGPGEFENGTHSWNMVIPLK